MRKALLSALLAVTAIAPAFSSASAHNGISFSSTSPFAIFSTVEIEGGLGTPARCGMVIDTALHSSVLKIQGTLSGNADLSFATVLCSERDVGLLVGGRRVLGAQGPYHLSYISFEGILPNISGLYLLINDVELWIDIGGITCLTNGAIDIVLFSAGNPMSTWEIGSANIPLTGAFLCIFSSGQMWGVTRTQFGPRMTLL